MIHSQEKHSDPSRPRVSVILPFLNGERFLAESIETVLRQTYTDWELILIDDGSREAATAIAKDYADRHPEKIRYIEHDGHGNLGAAASRNVGISAARGDLIAPLDGDDVWKPEKLSEQVAMLDRHPDVGMICGSVIYWYSWEGGIDQIVPTGHVRDMVVPPPQAALNLYPLGKTQAPTPSDLLIRRDILLAVGGFNASFNGPLQLYEDQVLLAKLYQTTPIYISSQAWLHYRQHQDSCVANVVRDGHYHRVRLYFLEWYRAYMRQQTAPRRDVVWAIERALWREKHLTVDRLLKLPAKVAFKIKRRIRSRFGLETSEW